MNLLGRHSFNVDGLLKGEQGHQPARAFGRDLTNTLGGAAIGKPVSRHKRTGSEHATSKEPSTKTQTKVPADTPTVLSQYEKEHFRVLFTEDQQPIYNGLLGITPKMRNILIDWLIDVHSSFSLSQRTLHLAYKYLDSYLCLKEASRSDLQLIGITCLWMASKYEQIYPPRVRVFVDVTANTYSAAQMLDMEMKVMTALNFELVKPTAYNIVEMLQPASQNRSFSLYAIELATLEGISLKFRQTVIAAAAINLSDSILKTKTPLKDINDLVSAREMAECFKELCSLLSESNRYGLKALSRKYGQSEWHSVSKIRLTPSTD